MRLAFGMKPFFLAQYSLHMVYLHAIVVRKERTTGDCAEQMRAVTPPLALPSLLIRAIDSVRYRAS